MKVKEDELIERLMNENEEFRKAKQTHAELAKTLDEMENKPYLTPQDEVEKESAATLREELTPPSR